MLYTVYCVLVTTFGLWSNILSSYVSEDEASVDIRWRSFWNVRTHAAMLAYTSAELRSIGQVKVRLRRPQHDDVIARVASVGIRRRPRRGSRAGRRRNKSATAGNPVTSPANVNLAAGDSPSTPPPNDVTHDQLISPPPPNSQRKRWELPTVFLANVRSLANKSDDLEATVQLNHSDIICLTETWLSDDVPSEAVSINDFSLFRNDRNRQGGGVACYVRSDLPCTRLQSFETPGLETLWLLIKPPRMPRWLSHILIGVVYHPPKANSYQMTEHIINCIDEVTRAHPNVGIAIVGDFNRLQDKPLRNYPLRQVVRGSTRKDAVLDKIFTNMSEWYNQPTVIAQVGLSDHKAVIMCPTGRGVRSVVKHEVEWVRSHDPNNKALFVHALHRANWAPLYKLTSCEDMVNLFYSIILSLLDQYMPLRPRLRNLNDKPWVTEEFRAVIRRRQYAWVNRQYADYRRYRNQALRLARTLRKRFYDAKVKRLRQSDNRNWWRQVKRFTGESKQCELSGLANSVASGSYRLLADMINESLQQVSEDLQPVCEEYLTSTVQVPDEFIISPEMVLARLERINVYKAPGPDNLPNWVLRDFAPFLCEPVCAIFNASVREGKVPLIWKKANVVPVAKVRPPVSMESDIRPISLTPTISKVLESMVGRWILDVVGSQLDDHQFGSLKGRSTTHALVDMLHHWNKALDDSQSVRVLFIDYAKAFDHVDHGIVIEKLKSLGVPEVIVRWTTSFLCERQQRVKISDVVSNWTVLRGGMPQGSWLGPLIFIILIDDLRLRLCTHKYLDDTTISETVEKDTESSMQQAADELIEWSENNRMNINCKKTKEMILGPLSKKSLSPLLIAAKPVQRVTEYKLLGVTVNATLKWDDHVNAITSKAAKRLWFLKKLKRAGVDKQDLVYFFLTVIRPVLEYACSAWHTSLTKQQTTSLENIQRRALQIIAGNIPYGEACCLFQLTSLSERRDSLCSKLFRQLFSQSHILHYLLPAQRDDELTGRLRSRNKYPTVRARTNRFKNSFIPYAVANYQ